MQAQRRRARSASSFGMDYNAGRSRQATPRSSGPGHRNSRPRSLHCSKAGQAVDRSLAKGDEGVVVLDRAPFYAESGGQVGTAASAKGAGVRFDVRDTTKAGGAILHHRVAAKGGLGVGTSVKAEVDASVRQATALNHSATRLLHAALRQNIGPLSTLREKGSLVNLKSAPALRLQSLKAITPAQLVPEAIVNREVRGKRRLKPKPTSNRQGQRCRRRCSVKNTVIRCAYY